MGAFRLVGMYDERYGSFGSERLKTFLIPLPLRHDFRSANTRFPWYIFCSRLHVTHRHVDVEFMSGPSVIHKVTYVFSMCKIYVGLQTQRTDDEDPTPTPTQTGDEAEGSADGEANGMSWNSRSNSSNVTNHSTLY